MATAGPTTKLADDFTVSAIGFGAGALSAYGDVDEQGVSQGSFGLMERRQVDGGNLRCGLSRRGLCRARRG